MEIMSTFCSTTNFRVTSERFYYNTISYLVERDPLSTQNILSSFTNFLIPSALHYICLKIFLPKENVIYNSFDFAVFKLLLLSGIFLELSKKEQKANATP